MMSSGEHSGGKPDTSVDDGLDLIDGVNPEDEDLRELGIGCRVDLEIRVEDSQSSWTCSGTERMYYPSWSVMFTHGEWEA